MASIKLSPQHGVNPAVPVCFFCGKPKDQIVLFGRLKGDAPAPANPIVDTEPCDECRAYMAQGVTLFGISAEPALAGQPACGKDDQGNPVYLSGSFVVVTEDAVRRLMRPDAAEAVIEAGAAHLDHNIVAQLVAASKQAEESKEGQP